MENAENKTRHHPDLFTEEEAVAYLRLDSAVTLATFRGKGWVSGYQAGKKYVYWRADLDDCALRIVGIEPPARNERKPLRLAK